MLKSSLIRPGDKVEKEEEGEERKDSKVFTPWVPAWSIMLVHGVGDAGGSEGCLGVMGRGGLPHRLHTWSP